MLPKKHLSQNFLSEQSILERIASEGRAHLFHAIFEIGAGEGALTEVLARHAHHVLALEFDRDLLPILREKFPPSSNVSLLEGDILHTSIDTIVKKYSSQQLPWAIFGNIPYAITGSILRKLTALEEAPQSIVLLVQKEVAERIVEKNKKRSLLSLSISLFGEAKLLFLVPKESFFPVPQVESAILQVIPHSNRLPFEMREAVLRLAKIGFASKRKTLANNFAAHRMFSKDRIERFLIESGKTKNARAEELSKEEWIELLRALSE